MHFALWVPQPRWQNQVFGPFRKTVKVGASLMSARMMFQRKGATTDKALLLGPSTLGRTATGELSRPYLIRPLLVFFSLLFFFSSLFLASPQSIREMRMRPTEQQRILQVAGSLLIIIIFLNAFVSQGTLWRHHTLA